jgi:uncharacterized membrane protein YhaH (DUF805 family)
LKDYKIYGPVIILVFFFAASFFLPSVYQKGGVDTDFYYIISMMVFVFSLMITYLRDIKFPGGFILSALFAVISLFLTTVLIVLYLVDKIYDDKTWFLWETKHRLFVNSLYYGINIILLIIMAYTYKKVRRQVLKKRRTSRS